MIEKNLYKVGDKVTFGRYVQMFKDFSPVEWRVLDTTDEKVLLLSDKALELQCYRILRDDIISTFENNFEELKKVLKKELSWENSDPRKWLNNYFFNSCFDDTEKNQIVPVRHISGFGEETEDRIFLLSRDEVEKYFPVPEDRLTGITMHVIKKMHPNIKSQKRLADLAEKKVKDWWLRTSGEGGAHYVSGRNSDVLCGIEYERNLLRPALWISRK
jgi:hypothetical protein